MMIVELNPPLLQGLVRVCCSVCTDGRQTEWSRLTFARSCVIWTLPGPIGEAAKCPMSYT